MAITHKNAIHQNVDYDIEVYNHVVCIHKERYNYVCNCKKNASISKAYAKGANTQASWHQANF